MDSAMATLTGAFVNDPLYQWLYPDPATRADALRANLSLTLRLARDHGVVHTSSGGQAIAVWTAPGVELLDDPAPFMELLEQWAPERIDAALAGMQACSEHQPSEPAWVLHLLAVHPDLQGQGVARSLVAPVLDQCDEAHVLAYLESSNERNVSFYRRCGFEVVAEVKVDDAGPIMRPMLRTPRSLQHDAHVLDRGAAVEE